MLYSVPQEDEAEILKRKQAAEEEDVDINMSVEPDETVNGFEWRPSGVDEQEDFAWADDEPDDDAPGWRMKVLMEDENELM